MKKLALWCELLSTQTNFPRFGVDAIILRLAQLSQATAAPSPSVGESPTASTTWDAAFQFAAGFIILIFLFAAFFFATISFVAIKSKEGFSDRYVRLSAVVLIVSLAICVAIANFPQQQSSAVLGLLGTIVGYLLGRTSTSPQQAAPRDLSHADEPAQLMDPKVAQHPTDAGAVEETDSTQSQEHPPAK